MLSRETAAYPASHSHDAVSGLTPVRVSVRSATRTSSRTLTTSFAGVTVSAFRRQILDALRGDPASATQIARNLATTRQRVNYHLKALEGAGLVELHEEDHWLSRAPTRMQMLEETVAFVRQHNPPD